MKFTIWIVLAVLWGGFAFGQSAPSPTQYERMLLSTTPPKGSNGEPVETVWVDHHTYQLFSVGPGLSAFSIRPNDSWKASLLDSASPVGVLVNIGQGVIFSFHTQGSGGAWIREEYDVAWGPGFSFDFSTSPEQGTKWGGSVYFAGELNSYTVGVGIQGTNINGSWVPSLVIPVSTQVSNMFSH